MWLLIGGLGSQWVGMGTKLMELQIFRQTVEDCQSALDEHEAQIDLIKILTDEVCKQTLKFSNFFFNHDIN